MEFQSTPPARGATNKKIFFVLGVRFQSTPPARGATAGSHNDVVLRMISIHAPREGGDIGSWSLTPVLTAFQSTPPARGATLACDGVAGTACLFQSTPPARGATVRPFCSGGCYRFQSTPPARGATVQRGKLFLSDANFNPRPPRGGRRRCRRNVGGATDFNPRPPRGGRPGSS